MNSGPMAAAYRRPGREGGGGGPVGIAPFTNHLPVRIRFGDGSASKLSLIAVPTTAGTGSEVSGGAVITDPGRRRKIGLASPRMRPQHAIVDPVLSHSMPPATTAHTGVDALAQAIAGMIARVHTPVG